MEAPKYEAETYVDARPVYPIDWFSMLADLTSDHSLAWDAGTGSGQAAVGVAKYYKHVIASDISEDQLKHSLKHPHVSYVHTPLSTTNEEFLKLIAPENSVDLITVATALHHFDLESFYSLVNRMLKKPGGVIAAWTYNLVQVSPEFDPLIERFCESSLPYQNPGVRYAFECYKTIPFPFESVGLGSEGHPKVLDMPKDMSFPGFLGLLRSWSAVKKAKDEGVELLSDKVIKEFQSAWGEPELVRTVIYKTYMLAGKVKV
ncbi:hypothetical protein K2173_000873 [Erythroxylum novogranatense]|uniref:Methyltransferase type 11 domain-containing protein n=1 Tax=Erythroxylum novogranatense TaxID=1862640 RepID=A0AAV8TTK4_9ROSI|nr:hypothetical protein K2173_000873 [Erythroxylum novogranatense]